jgi:transposase-like protein
MAERETYSAELNTRAVLELLREEKTVDLGGLGVRGHPNQLRHWKQTALERLPSVFTRDGVIERQLAE